MCCASCLSLGGRSVLTRKGPAAAQTDLSLSCCPSSTRPETRLAVPRPPPPPHPEPLGTATTGRHDHRRWNEFKVEREKESTLDYDRYTSRPRFSLFTLDPKAKQAHECPLKQGEEREAYETRRRDKRKTHSQEKFTCRKRNQTIVSSPFIFDAL